MLHFSVCQDKKYISLMTARWLFLENILGPVFGFLSSLSCGESRKGIDDDDVIKEEGRKV